MKWLISPHSDDEALFASFIIMHFKPKVLIVTDGQQHEDKFGVPKLQRRQESTNALNALGTSVEFLGIKDTEITLESVISQLKAFKRYHSMGIVFAPSKEGGNEHHDIVSDACREVFGDRVIWYHTYTKDRLYPQGKIEIVPTDEERKKKQEILQFYKSQLAINRPHFDAVEGRSEYVS